MLYFSHALQWCRAVTKDIMQIIRFNGTVGEFDSLNWETGFQGFEQWLNKRTRLNHNSDRILVINSTGIIICTRWIIYDDLSVSDLKIVQG